MSDFDYQGDKDQEMRDELFSVPVRAGKRIYYFDVKATRNDDYYITVTESRKRQMRDGSFVIDKHKLHLYKEDFEKFADGLQEVIAYIREHKPQDEQSMFNHRGADRELEQEIPTEEKFFGDL